MAKPQIKLDYKNITSVVIGAKDGITPTQLKSLGKKIKPLISKINKQRKAGKTPFRDLPYNKRISMRVNALVKTLRKECDYLVVLGIGGSALGNIALDTALCPFLPDPKNKQSRRPQLFVLDNVDPAQFGSFLDYIKPKLKRTVFNVISKSGRTSETASQFMIIREMLINALGRAGYQKQVVATTDANSGTLRTIADNDKLKTLEVPNGVGGRFSVLSAVGLFSAAMCGINISQLLAGARDMDARVKTSRFLENPAAINAAINYHYYTHGKPISVMMPYSYALKDMADWYRQLWAESLGKKFDLNKCEVWAGPTPVKAIGTTDQHSQVQLYREGPNDKLFTFLQVNNFGRDVKIGPAPDCAPELGFLAGKKMSTLFNDEKKATEYALIESKRPNMTVIFEKVNAYAVGQFIYLYEVTTSLMGALLGIDTYNQPAVELVKEATFALMGKEGYEDFAQKIQSKTEIDEDFLV
ncbi:MAG: glucose-6-phosphate isomerase [Planctomycetaceae bacterium]|nr:MAG: glucose-6-phosphate isomerase [Planctomycetaceae bacterium]